LISNAARDRVKLAIDQLEEQFHTYDQKANDDTLESYEAALNRGKAMGFQEAAHYVKSALHDIDVKSL
jgi:flagellar biosynthesis/type III secretory pathway protein FliH